MNVPQNVPQPDVPQKVPQPGGQSTADRIAQAKKSAIPGRLRKGAGVLGRLWKEGVRCQTGSGWGKCLCKPQTDFCEAKSRWVALLKELHDGELPIPEDDFYVLEAMTVSQIRETGLTIQVAGPIGRPPIRIGPTGTSWRTIVDLSALDEDRVAAWDAVVQIQKAMEEK